MKTGISLLIFLTCAAIRLMPVEIKNMGIIPIDQSQVYLQKVSKFTVTEDEFFLFPDMKAGDVKIFDNTGKLVKVLGRKGLGPQEYVAPYFCDYKKPYFIVLDWGKHKLLSFQRENKLDFKPLSESLILALGYDVKFIAGNRILISGYAMDSESNEYDLYFLDPETQKKDFLLPDYLKYGCSSKREKDNIYPTKIAPLSIYGFCDYINGSIYFVWKGDLRILKINSSSKKVDYFGKKTGKYIKPEVTPQLLKMHNNREKGTEVIRQKMSWVTGIFADPDFVALVYSNYKAGMEGWQTIIQFYTLKGDFIEEKELPGAINISSFPEPFFCYTRETKMLYYLAWKIDPQYEDVYQILKFKISIKGK